MIFPCGTGGELFFELASAMLAQCSNQGLGKWDGSVGGAGLGLMECEFAIYPL